MTWLTPMWAALAASVAVPTLLILYFLKLRRRDMEISTTLLWKKAIQDLQANAPFQKLRRNILLILQLLILAAVLLALGQPQIRGEQLAGQKNVILIDRSASMLATDEKLADASIATRLDAAKEQAERIVDQLSEPGFFETGSADEAMIIAFDTSAEVLQTFTSDKAALKRALNAVESTEGPTSMEEAMRLARAHAPRKFVEGQAIEGLDTGEAMSIHIFSDGRIPDALKAKPGPKDSVEYHTLGNADSLNVGIVSLRAEREFENPAKLSVHVSLTNNSAAPRSVEVELLLDGEIAAIKSANLPAAKDASGAILSPVAQARNEGQTGEASAAMPMPAEKKLEPGLGGLVFQLDRSEGALVAVRLRQPGTGEGLSEDVLSLDNRGWLVVPPAKRMAVAMVSTRPDRSLVLAVLEGLPLSRLTELTPQQCEDLARQEKLGEYDLIVLDSYLPKVTDPDTPGLPPGRFLVLNALPQGTSGIADKGKGGATAIVDWSRDHPVLRSISLDTLLVAESRLVELEKGSMTRAIASADNGPAILELSKADTRAIIVTFDITQTNWPFEAGFVVFFGSAVRYLGEEGFGATMPRGLQPGTVLSDRLPSSAANVEVKLTGGDSQKLTPAADGRIVYGPLKKSGVYEVTWDGPPGPTDIKDGSRSLRVFAANLLDSDESNVGSASNLSLASQVVAARDQAPSAADKRLWPWLLLAALGVIMLEWFVYNRKVHI
jgi:hypothetical protein